MTFAHNSVKSMRRSIVRRSTSISPRPGLVKKLSGELVRRLTTRHTVRGEERADSRDGERCLPSPLQERLSRHIGCDSGSSGPALFDITVGAVNSTGHDGPRTGVGFKRNTHLTRIPPPML